MGRRVVARWGACLAIALGAAASAPSADAISEGEPARWSDYPWVASVGDDECGAVLVASKRLLTTASCAESAEGASIRVGGVRRRAIGVALPPTLVAELASGERVDCSEPWEETECVPDLALLRLATPVRRVTPPALTRAPIGRHGLVLGHGTRDITDDESAPARLRAAPLQVISDTRCRARYRRLGRRYLIDLPAQDTICSRDPRPPRNAGICVGDGGAPLVARHHDRWRLLGIGSWANACGEGGWPSVFADVWRHRAFIRQPEPTWRPIGSGHARLSGIGRVGQTLTCRAPRFAGHVDQVVFWFSDEGAPLRTFQRGAEPTYVVRDSDRGERITCWALAINAGGVARAVTDLDSVLVE